MVWSRANLVAPVGPPPRCLNHRRSAGCTPVAFPVGCCLGRRGGETLHCCRLPRHRLTSGAATQLHHCADLLCCACRCRYCLLSHCSSAPLSYGSATAAHCCAASYIAATPRRAHLLPHRVAPLRLRRSAAAASLGCCPTPPQPLCCCRAAPLHCRVAPLRVTLLHAASSAPRRLAAGVLSFWQPLQARDLRGRTAPLLSSPLPSFALLSYPLLSCLLLSSPLSCLESKTTLCFVSFG